MFGWNKYASWKKKKVFMEIALLLICANYHFPCFQKLKNW